MSSSSRSDSIVPHLRVYAQCGACNRPVQTKDCLVAIRFRLFSTFAGAIHKVPSFRKGQLVERKNGAVFCKQEECSTCLKNPIGNATFHADCFNLFGRYCHAEDKYTRLWLAARKMPPIKDGTCIKHMYDPVASQQLNIIFDLLGLQMLPLSLTSQIWSFESASSHIVARFCSVLQLAAEMNSAPPVPSICPLREVRSWSRGQYHIAQKDMGSELPYLLVTVDSRGIKELKRVDTPSGHGSDMEASTSIDTDMFFTLDADFRVSIEKGSSPRIGHIVNFGSHGVRFMPAGASDERLLGYNQQIGYPPFNRLWTDLPTDQRQKKAGASPIWDRKEANLRRNPPAPPERTREDAGRRRGACHRSHDPDIEPFRPEAQSPQRPL